MSEALRLSDRQWRGFRVDDLFEVVNCTPVHKVNLQIKNVGIPYITRTSQNNGLEEIISWVGNKNPANVITFGAESVKFFCQPYEFVTGNKMYYLARKNNEQFTVNTGLFITHCCNSSLSGTGYGYGMGLTGTRFKSRKILLPVTTQSLSLADKALSKGATQSESDTLLEPDWDFMERYIHTHTHSIMSKVPSDFLNLTKSRILESSLMSNGGSLE